jgi:hypothetical protein
MTEDFDNQKNGFAICPRTDDLNADLAFGMGDFDFYEVP